MVEKTQLRETKSTMEKQLSRTQTAERNMQRKCHELNQEKRELQLALKVVPGAHELHEIKHLVAEYAQHIADTGSFKAVNADTVRIATYYIYCQCLTFGRTEH